MLGAPCVRAASGGQPPRAHRCMHGWLSRRHPSFEDVRRTCRTPCRRALRGQSKWQGMKRRSYKGNAWCSVFWEVHAGYS